MDYEGTIAVVTWGGMSPFLSSQSFYDLTKDEPKPAKITLFEPEVHASRSSNHQGWAYLEIFQKIGSALGIELL